MKDYLIYTSAGKNSNIPLWVSEGNQNFDIWVTNYSDIADLWKEYSTYYNQHKGAKFPNFHKVFFENREMLTNYKAIMIADDDIIISANKLNGLFNLLSTEDLNIVTPAFSRMGKISHATTERQLISEYRFTNFAEVTCPIFRTGTLEKFMQIYNPSEAECFGVDWWYLHHLESDLKGKIVISDKYYCTNPLDTFKHDGVREINRHYSENQRRAKWEQLKDSRNLDTFDKVISSQVRNNIYTILKLAPLYYFEILFNFAHQKIRESKLKPLIKKIILICKIRR